MKTQHQVIIEALQALGGSRRIAEIEAWVRAKYGAQWKNFSTPLADMVPVRLGGNQSSTIPGEFRVLARTDRRIYRLVGRKDRWI